MPSHNKKNGKLHRDYSGQYQKYSRWMNSDLAMYGLLLCLTLILSYVESIIPNPVPIPGVKIGLANIVLVWALYSMGWKQAAALSFIRVALMTILFGNLYSALFSIAGAALSLLVMVFLKKSGRFQILGVSIAGGVLHNLAQIIVAMIVLENGMMISYLPFLLISGIVAGVVVGILSGVIYSKIRINTGNEKQASKSNMKAATIEKNIEDNTEENTEDNTEEHTEKHVEEHSEEHTEEHEEENIEDNKADYKEE